MQFGIFLPPGHNGEKVSDFIEQATLAEDVGFDLIGVADSQSIFKELYSSLSLVAHETDSIAIGPAVTNPITRHPVVTASAICTIDDVSDGRAYLGIGTGDSGVYTLGEKPARLTELEEYINVIRSLTTAEPTEHQGHEVQLKWLQDAEQPPDIPVSVAAEGPKTLELAGRMADRVFIGTGLLPPNIKESIDRVNTGAREAGKDPSAVTKWVLARANVGVDRDEAIDEIKMELAASANHAFRFTMEDKQVPEKHRDAIRTLQERYDPHEHEALGETTHHTLVDELGLTDYLADRFAIVGTVDDCINKLHEIASVDGVDGVLLTAYDEDKQAFITRFGEDIISSV